ncbi:hypothetical protein AB0I82_13825 [Streptomyces sp. NPDC050315]|uniref:hypothetical protein n=1 Tax=Streptomyces sp. NPDC050315 TaxID=3155039 RepID=UPI00342D1F72
MNSRPPQFSVRIRLQIALIAVAVGATLLATWQFGESSGAYQDAVRQDIKRQAAVTENVRAVYADEAPFAFQVAVAQARAEHLRPLKDEGRLAASEYTLAAQTAYHLRRSASPDSLLGNDGYRYKDLGYDLPRRLADLQWDSPDLYALDPDATLRAGDRWATWGLASVAVGIAAVLAAVCAANVLRPRRWRRALAPSDRPVVRGVEIIPQPAIAPRGRRRVVLFHLFVFVLPLLLPLGQILVAGSEQRAHAEAARGAVRLSASIGVYGQRTAFLTESLRTAKVAEIRAVARELASLDTGITPGEARHERVMAAVEGVLVDDVRKIAEYMGRPPTAADRVDTEAATALGKEPKNLSAAQAEQQRQADLAQRAGRRSLLLSAATAIGVVAEILAVAALSIGRRAWRWWPMGGAVVSVGLTAVAFL